MITLLFPILSFSVILNIGWRSIDDEYLEVKDGVLYIQSVAFARAIGADVDWDSAHKCVILEYGKTEIKIFTRSGRVWRNNEIFTLRNMPFIENGRSYIPLREIAEIMGFNLRYDERSKKIEVELGLSKILNVNILTDGKTRAILEFSKSVNYKVVEADESKLIVDVFGAFIDPPHLKKEINSSSLVSFTLSQFNPSTVRIVFHYNVGTTFRISVEEVGRFVFDFENVGYVEEMVKKRKTSVSKSMRIVIDPGHGGVDSGAVGIFGNLEKDIVLKIAKEMGKKLKEKGFMVYYTRVRDSYVDLYDRAKFANSVNADLFLSVHLNSCDDKSVEGMEIYYFDFSEDGYIRRLVWRENLDPVKDKDKIAIRVMKKRNHTAESLEMAEDLAKFLKDRGFKVRGVKKGEFAVLAYTNMPSLLLECDFLSNPSVEMRLVRGSYSEKIAEVVAEWIGKYFSKLW